MRLRAFARPLGVAALLAGAAAVVLANTGRSAGAEVASGWWVAGGFAAVAAGIAALRGPEEGSLMALVFGLYVGVSAALAALAPARDDLDARTGFAAVVHLPFAGIVDHGPGLAPTAFYPTLKLASAGGLLCVLVVVLVAGDARTQTRTTSLDAGRLEQASNVLIGAGIVGALLSAAHFALAHKGAVLSTEALRSFWHGGAYTTLLAQVAIPGLGMRLSLQVERHAGRRPIAITVAGLVVAAALSTTTGERGFLIETGLVVVAVMATHRRWFRLLLAPAVIVGLMLLVVTQATRDALRLDHSASPAVVAKFLTPDQWRRSLQNQFSSFQWASDVRQYGSAIRGTDPLLALLAKPIPRQLWPGKPNGLSEQFTRTVYPTAAAAGVQFAVPLYSELDFSLGAAGALAGLALLGAALAAGMRAAFRWPAALRPVARSLFLWAAFALIRGDLSSAVPVALATVLPVGVLVWWSRVAAPRKLILDSLAVPPEYSGVGATVRRIGAELCRSRIELPVPIVVRCAADARASLAPSFPPGTAFETPIRSSRPAWRRLVYQLGIAPLRDHRASLIVTVSELSSWWGRASRALVIHDLRRLLAPDSAAALERRVYRAIVPAALRRADAILAVSGTTAEDLRAELSPTAPVTVVAPHAGLTIISREPRLSDTRLVAVGAIRPYKGAELLVDALERLAPDRRPEVEWVGAIELDPGAAEGLRRRATATGMKLCGWLPEAELTTTLSAATALIAPSRFEGYGLSVLEALQRGLPVLASDIPAHHEIAGDAAIYFDPSDAAELARLLERLTAGEYDLDRLAELSLDRARELAGQSPSWGEALSIVLRQLSSAAATTPPRCSRATSLHPADTHGAREAREDAAVHG